MSDTLIKVEGVSKKFCRSLKRSLWYGMKDLGNEVLGRRHGGNGELRPDEFWAVKDVSFELKRGECLGLIGHNGAGKSTLLKMLNGLIKPDKGRISMRGRVGALIELGAGFNPILTGRENIYVNGAVLGFTKEEIDRKFEEIVEFAEVAEFIDAPVQNYSSGMKVRLGFAIAAQMEPDVLMIDEVLAVGDAAFRTKCINRMDKLSRDAALVFVTHSMPMMARISTSVLLMNKGSVKFGGQEIEKGISAYFDSIRIGQLNHEISDYFKLKEIKINNRKNEIDMNSCLSQDDVFELEATFEVIKKYPDFIANISFFDLENKPVLQSFSAPLQSSTQEDSKELRINLNLENLPLTQGSYSIHLSMIEARSVSRKGEIIYANRGVAPIRIKGGKQGWAPVQVNGTWSLEHRS